MFSSADFKERLFWGKAEMVDGIPVKLLPLSAHCLDVAAVFRALVSIESFRKRLEIAASVTLTEGQLDRLAVLCLFHDLGKVNLGFQNKIFGLKSQQIGHIGPLLGLFAHFSEELGNALDVTSLSSWFDSEEAIESFLVAAWSHHGAPIMIDVADQTGINSDPKWWQAAGEKDPFAEIANLLRIAKENFPQAFQGDIAPMPNTAAFQHRFAGLVMLADWLGSHRAHFPVSGRGVSFDSFDTAKAMLIAVGLDITLPKLRIAEAPQDFCSRFGFSSMNPLQKAMAEIPTASKQSRLLIAEAETGSGKTEAALCRFIDLFAAGEVDAMYFALPTRVAARELYHRVRACIDRLIPDPADRPPVVLAVPGYAQFDGIKVASLFPDASCRSIDLEEDRLRERAWAAEHPKRFLAAPVAVGTIDQALLSSLKVKHAHLRSVCLDRSLLIVDEVHASDVYMRQLLRFLLSHHLSLGGHALLLSATLGSVARAEFVAGLNKPKIQSFEEAIATPYPAITDGSGITIPAIVQSKEAASKCVQLETSSVMELPEKILPIIVKALEEGCRVLVILNTVSRAVSLFKQAELTEGIGPERLFSCCGVSAPHHGRFAPKDRELLDGAVAKRLGKNSASGPILLIGTQTLEQSLDIDADILITDLCPMDVLLQRIGRLHRHKRERPAHHESARCVVLVPSLDSLEQMLNDNGTPKRTALKLGLGSVYEDMRVLELTRQLILANNEICIPKQNRFLVESATHPERLSSLVDAKMKRHSIHLEGSDIAEKITAGSASIVDLYDREFNHFRFNELQNTQYRTRLGLEALQVPIVQPIKSPFGTTLEEFFIPGHLAPKDIKRTDGLAQIITMGDTSACFKIGEKHYNYSRYGLEQIDDCQ